MSKDLRYEKLKATDTCSNCGAGMYIINTRHKGNVIVRRRHCPMCSTRFNSYEIHEDDIEKLFEVLESSDDIKKAIKALEVILNG